MCGTECTRLDYSPYHSKGWQSVHCIHALATWISNLQESSRSMTSTFSTISMLGLLRRLHKMEIQLKLEAEGENAIVYPRVEQHRKKRRIPETV